MPEHDAADYAAARMRYAALTALRCYALLPRCASAPYTLLIRLALPPHCLRYTARHTWYRDGE